MLAVLGYLMIAVFMVLVISGRLSALTGLILVPVVFGFLAGAGTDIGPMMLEGIEQVAPTGIMLVFAILFFGLMIDTGLFDPLTKRIIRVAKGDPLKVTVGTVILGSVVAIDGDGTSTFLIIVTAMLPLYKKLGMNLFMLACLSLLSIGIMNMVPWGGHTTRAIASLQLSVEQVFFPLVPVMVAGILFNIGVAVHFGRKERKRLGIQEMDEATIEELHQEGRDDEDSRALLRPRLVYFNALLVIGLLVVLISQLLPAEVVFIIGFAIALLINYPNLQTQKERVSAHAANVLATVSLLFASGIFTGIMNGTGMVDQMARSLINVIPEGMGQLMPLITALASIPFTYFMSNDPYYFGVLPVVAETASSYGVSPAEIARASVLGQPAHVLSPLFAAGYLLVGMLDLDWGQNQKFALKWAILSCLFLIVVSLLLGVISI